MDPPYLELVEGLGQSLDGLHVQVIGRFVQDVEVGTGGQEVSRHFGEDEMMATVPAAVLPGHGHLGEGHSALLSSRQAGYRPGGQLPGDAVAPQLVAVLLLRPSCRNQGNDGSKRSAETPPPP